MQTLRKELINILNDIEEALSITANRCDIWQDRIIYAYGKAIWLIITWILKKGEPNDREV